MEAEGETMLLQSDSCQHMEQATGICRGCIIRQLIQEMTRQLDLGCGHITSSAYIHNNYKLQVRSHRPVRFMIHAMIQKKELQIKTEEVILKSKNTKLR